MRPGPVLAWLAVAIWAAVIFVLSATPNLRVAEAADLDFVLRKAGHMAAFGILAVLVWQALISTPRRGRLISTPRWGSLILMSPWRAVVLSWVLTLAYAASDEFHQSFTAGRHASGVDVGIDSAGAAIALVAVVVWLHWRVRRRA